MAWKFEFLLLTFFFQLISLWSVRLPEYTPLILGMTSGSLSLTSVSWKENKQADERGNTEWDWEVSETEERHYEQKELLIGCDPEPFVTQIFQQKGEGFPTFLSLCLLLFICMVVVLRQT